MSFRLTYATMFDPPESMHTAFDAALAEVRVGLGQCHGLFIAGADERRADYQTLVSPIDTDLLLGEFALASAEDVERAIAERMQNRPGYRYLGAVKHFEIFQRR